MNSKTDSVPTDQLGEGFAFFRWACLTTNPELTYYPGLIVRTIWARDWAFRDFRRVIYDR